MLYLSREKPTRAKTIAMSAACTCAMCIAQDRDESKVFPINSNPDPKQVGASPAVPISVEPHAGRRDASVAITAIQNVAAGVPWPCDKQSSNSHESHDLI